MKIWIRYANVVEKLVITYQNAITRLTTTRIDVFDDTNQFLVIAGDYDTQSDFLHIRDKNIAAQFIFKQNFFQSKSSVVS